VVLVTSWFLPRHQRPARGIRDRHERFHSGSAGSFRRAAICSLMVARAAKVSRLNHGSTRGPAHRTSGAGRAVRPTPREASLYAFPRSESTVRRGPPGTRDGIRNRLPGRRLLGLAQMASRRDQRNTRALAEVRSQPVLDSASPADPFPDVKLLAQVTLSPTANRRSSTSPQTDISRLAIRSRCTTRGLRIRRRRQHAFAGKVAPGVVEDRKFIGNHPCGIDLRSNGLRLVAAFIQWSAQPPVHGRIRRAERGQPRAGTKRQSTCRGRRGFVNEGEQVGVAVAEQLAGAIGCGASLPRRPGPGRQSQEHPAAQQATG
jgi:hypothetical protein